MPSERDLMHQIQSEVARLVQAVADAGFWHARVLEQANAAHERRAAEIEAVRRQAFMDGDAAYQAALASVTGQVRTISDAGGLLAAPWTDPRWRSWSPSSSQPPLSKGDGGARVAFTRLGQLIEPGKWHRLAQPALIPLIGGRGVLLRASGSNKAIAVRAAQSVLLRLLASTPPARLRFTFVDPVGLGQNVAPSCTWPTTTRRW